jgi:predicted DNA-binding transcriptional regulator YafY
MRADRLLSLLLLLQNSGRITAAELAERLEVSERTIYRDLDALSAAGVPVYAERGRNGGCVLREGYRTDLTGLNEAEVVSLFAGTTARALDALGLSAGLQRAMTKLEAALPATRRADAVRVRARVHVDATAWFGAQEPTPHLRTLHTAVFTDRMVQLDYRHGDGRAGTRRVAPLGLVAKGGIWYLVASTGGDLRVFRVSRIRRVRFVRGRVTRPPRFDLAAFWRDWSQKFIASIPQYRATVRVKRAILPVLPQVFGEQVRPLIEAVPRAAGTVHLDLTFDSLAAACGKLLGLGADAEVVQPPELRHALQQMAASVTRRYRKGGLPAAWLSGSEPLKNSDRNRRWRARSPSPKRNGRRS